MAVADWCIVVLSLLAMVFSVLRTRKYTRSVADFLAANRCAGRYLLTVSEGIAGLGAITIVAGFEIYYNTGFTAAWWAFLLVAVRTGVLLSGWVVYKFRQTRAMTLAEFLETRYSKRFRVFAGVMAWLAGIINFGVFPAVGTRFLIFFCGLPETMGVYASVLAMLVAVALLFTYMGGQIAVIVTDFLQGTFTNFVFIVIIVTLLLTFNWDIIGETLLQRSEQASMINPFKTAQATDFNIWFFLIQAWAFVYTMGIWQGNQGYNCSAINAHEARMGKVLSTWRIMAVDLFVMFVPVCAYVFYNNSEFEQIAQKANLLLGAIDNPQIAKQMRTVVALKSVLPIGVAGGFVTLMLAAFISTHDTYLHSWGSIFIQDVVMPFRKKPISSANHIKLLRLSILGVAVFIYLFSLLYRQTEYISMFFMITGAIFVGGAGAVVIGGLYWKKGTTQAAWLSMITGSMLSVGAIIVKQVHEYHPFANKVMVWIAQENGALLSFYASIIAIAVYIVVSILTSKQNFNMDMMLHRGDYAVDGEVELVSERKSKLSFSSKLLGITDEFSSKDRLVYLATMGWTALVITVFVAGMVAKFAFGASFTDGQWLSFWKWYFYVVFGVSILTTVWFTIGGAIDLRRMIELLSGFTPDSSDDGVIRDDSANNVLAGEKE